MTQHIFILSLSVNTDVSLALFFYLFLTFHALSLIVGYEVIRRLLRFCKGATADRERVDRTRNPRNHLRIKVVPRKPELF